MTKSEIQAKYTTLAAKVGDLYMRLETAKYAVSEMNNQMADLLKERRNLEEDLKTAVDDPVAEVVDPNV